MNERNVHENVVACGRYGLKRAIGGAGAFKQWYTDSARPRNSEFQSLKISRVSVDIFSLVLEVELFNFAFCTTSFCKSLNWGTFQIGFGSLFHQLLLLNRVWEFFCLSIGSLELWKRRRYKSFCFASAFRIRDFYSRANRDIFTTLEIVAAKLMLRTAFLSSKSFANGAVKKNRKLGSMAIRTNHAYTYSSSDLGKILKQQLVQSVMGSWRSVCSGTRHVIFVHLLISLQRKTLTCWPDSAPRLCDDW